MYHVNYVSTSASFNQWKTIHCPRRSNCFYRTVLPIWDKSVFLSIFPLFNTDILHTSRPAVRPSTSGTAPRWTSLTTSTPPRRSTGTSAAVWWWPGCSLCPDKKWTSGGCVLYMVPFVSVCTSMRHYRAVTRFSWKCVVCLRILPVLVATYAPDALDNLSNTTAVQLANQVLKKDPTLHVAKVQLVLF